MIETIETTNKSNQDLAGDCGYGNYAVRNKAKRMSLIISATFYTIFCIIYLYYVYTKGLKSSLVGRVLNLEKFTKIIQKTFAFCTLIIQIAGR